MEFNLKHAEYRVYKISSKSKAAYKPIFFLHYLGLKNVILVYFYIKQ